MGSVTFVQRSGTLTLGPEPGPAPLVALEAGSVQRPWPCLGSLPILLVSGWGESVGGGGCGAFWGRSGHRLVGEGWPLRGWPLPARHRNSRNSQASFGSQGLLPSLAPSSATPRTPPAWGLSFICLSAPGLAAGGSPGPCHPPAPTAGGRGLLGHGQPGRPGLAPPGHRGRGTRLAAFPSQRPFGQEASCVGTWQEGSWPLHSGGGRRHFWDSPGLRWLEGEARETGIDQGSGPQGSPGCSGSRRARRPVSPREHRVAQSAAGHSRLPGGTGTTPGAAPQGWECWPGSWPEAGARGDCWAAEQDLPRKLWPLPWRKTIGMGVRPPSRPCL